MSIYMIPAFIVAIGLLVAIHEYGHFLVARLCGIKVLRFSVGFGKPILLRRAGPDQTEYCISALPLGGYVRMLDEREGRIDPADQERTFQAQPIWQRIAVLVAGPAANFAFVIVAFWILFLIGVPAQRAVVGAVADGSYAAAAGVAEGDEIVAVDGRAVTGWEAAYLGMLKDMSDDGVIRLSVVTAGGTERQRTLDVGAERNRLTEPGALLGGLGLSVWRLPAVVGGFPNDSAAADAGMRAGDRIVAIDGQPVGNFNDLVDYMSAVTTAAPIELLLDRGGRELAVTVTPTPGSRPETKFQLGVTPDTSALDGMFSLRQLGPLAAVPAALQRTVSETAYTLTMLGRIVTGDVSVKNLSGPISIAQFAGIAVERGLDEYIRFLALISISLGVLNLLPVPMLDGGQIVYQLIEGATGKPLSERAQIVGQQVGLFVLLSVMGFAFYNDIARLFGS
ncbi:MAG: RIP metalloprotease RseP [Pseudomonadota bacterium]